MDDTMNLGLTKEQAAQLSELIEDSLKEMSATDEIMIKFELTGEQAKLLSELLEECVQELRATNEAMARRQPETDRLRAETEANIARLQERAERGWDVETILGPFPADVTAQ